ncbi:DUF4952 domain-containing protein [Agrobacterium sp. NPDC090283]|uniref:DUF4952 domain-containing protein n=1 Tax=Agrobacterium sp. NPDC090283 TaxID=3363920 RepID=UPI00383ACE5A
MIRIITATLITLLPSSVGWAASPDTPAADTGIGPKRAAACGDLLLGLEHKPQRLDFLGCRVDMVYGLKALVADYRVEGRYAEAIERYFADAANMPVLGFYCCGWDSIGAAGRDGWLQDGVTSYEISMGSGETLFNRREDWPRISWFSVTVTHYIEEP